VCPLFYLLTISSQLLYFRSATPRPEITESILERALKFYPEIFAPPEVLAKRKPTLEDIRPRIIEEGCGLRPARKGGIRLGVEWTNSVKPGAASEKEKKVPLIFNYGCVFAFSQFPEHSLALAVEDTEVLGIRPRGALHLSL
jgi:hypothetical protein